MSAQSSKRNGDSDQKKNKASWLSIFFGLFKSNPSEEGQIDQEAPAQTNESTELINIDVSQDLPTPKPVQAEGQQAQITQLDSDLNTRQELALKSIDAGLWDWDIVGDVLYFSPRWKSMLGYRPEELDDKYVTWTSLVHPEDFHQAETMMNAYLSKKLTAYKIELRMRTRSGEYRWVLTQGTAVWDSTGKPVRLTGWNFDIHDDKLRQNDFIEIANSRNEILASIQDGFLSVKADFTITYANQAAANLTQFPVDSLLGVKMTELFKDDSAGKFFRQYERALRAQINVEFEAKYMDTYFHVLAYPSAAGLSILFRDVTEHVELRRDVEDQKLALLSASRLATLGEMAGGIAHEINNPLAVIVGKAQTLRMLMSKPNLDLAKISKSIDSIEDTGNRIAKIIKGLRSFARDEEQDPFVTVSFASIIEDTLSFSQARFHSHGVDLRLGELPPAFEMIECRPAQLGQVVLNLLNNALEAVMSLSERWVAIQCEVTETKFTLKVLDSGQGISESVRDKIMNPFFTTKQVGQGTGLGLSISKGIVSSHGGDLFYDPSSTHTCFVVELPKKQMGLASGPKAIQPILKGGGGNSAA